MLVSMSRGRLCAFFLSLLLVCVSNKTSAEDAGPTAPSENAADGAEQQVPTTEAASPVPEMAADAATQSPPEEAIQGEAATIPVGSVDEVKPVPSEKDVTQLDDVIVTATKRAKSMRDIAASMSEFSGETLEQRGQLNMDEYLQQKPGVTTAEIAPGLIRVTVRGISTYSSPTSGKPQGTGMLVDDVAFTDAYIANIQPDLSAFDLESVELLRGPQGTLFGGAGLSGAVRFNLQQPEMGVFKARAFSQYIDPHEGSHAVTSGAAVNVPLYTDRLAVRLAYVKRKYPGVTDWTRPPVQKDVEEGGGEQIRGILSWQPLDELNVRLTHLDQDFFSPVEITTTDTPDARETSRLLLPRVNANNFKMDSLRLAYQFESFEVISLIAKLSKHWDLYSDATSVYLGSLPAGTPQIAGSFLTVLDDSRSRSQELRFQSTNEEGFQWLLGFYNWNFDGYFSTLGDTRANQILHGASGTAGDVTYSNLAVQTSIVYAVSQPDAYERAVFFDLSHKFWDRLELTGGARFYKTNVHGGFYGTGVVPRSQNYGREIDYSNNELTEKGISPKLSATFDFTKDISTYVLASRGFRFGGLQSIPSTPTNGVPISFKSDKIWNYEWGFRTAWFSNTLQIDPTVFYIDYQDPQISQSSPGPLSLGYTTNVGAAVSKGAEISIRWLTPIPGLQFMADGGITKAYTTVPFENDDGDLIAPGAWMPGGSRSQYTVGLDFILPYRGLATVAAHVDYSYIGKAYSDIENLHPVNDYGLLNAGLTFSTDIWRVKPIISLNVSNIQNVTKPVYWETGEPLTGLGEYQTYLLTRPRTVTARIGLEF